MGQDLASALRTSFKRGADSEAQLDYLLDFGSHCAGLLDRCLGSKRLPAPLLMLGKICLEAVDAGLVDLPEVALADNRPTTSELHQTRGLAIDLQLPKAILAGCQSFR